jgi:hypothetical protein
MKINMESAPNPQSAIENNSVKVNFEGLTEQQNRLVVRMIETYPILSNVKVKLFKPLDELNVGGFYDLSLDENGKCICTIYVSEGGPEVLKPIFEKLRATVAVNAEQLGITVDQMTPEILQLFIMAHEFGHIVDFIKNYKDENSSTDENAVDEMQYHRESSLSILPVPFVYPGDLAMKLEKHPNITRQELFELFPSLENFSEKVFISGASDLLSFQERWYRNTPSESYADNFAVNFLRTHAAYLNI